MKNLCIYILTRCRRRYKSKKIEPSVTGSTFSFHSGGATKKHNKKHKGGNLMPTIIISQPGRKSNMQFILARIIERMYNEGTN